MIQKGIRDVVIEDDDMVKAMKRDHIEVNDRQLDCAWIQSKEGHTTTDADVRDNWILLVADDLHGGGTRSVEDQVTDDR